MIRKLILLLVIAGLLAAGSGVLYMYENVPREDPLGKRLLYLPTPDFLKIFSMGNQNLVADFYYLWSIQYYAQFPPNTQFLYLDQVFDLITELDPLYRDPYRVGAIIMLIEAEGDKTIRKQSVLKLLDKGIEAIKDDFTLAQEAAWHCYTNFEDYVLAAKYAKIAAEHPNADHWAKRMYGQFATKSNTFDLTEALRYWHEMDDSAETDYQRMASHNMLYDLYSRRDKKLLEPYLLAFKEQFGRCPGNWQEIIDSGVTVNGRRMAAILKDFAGNEYGIDTEKCTVYAIKLLSEQQ